MTRPTNVLTAGVRLILGCLVVGTLAGVAMAGAFLLACLRSRTLQKLFSMHILMHTPYRLRQTCNDLRRLHDEEMHAVLMTVVMHCADVEMR